MKNFWAKLTKPFFALAPMDDVTDTVFRQIIAKYAPADVYFTEFTNIDALLSKGEQSALKRLRFTEKERPIIAQIWGIDPKKFYEASKKIVQLGFDGIDINMGCPVKDVVKAGACSALIRNPTLAQEIIQATKEGSGNLPVSIKTRIGFNTIQIEEWLGFLLKQNLSALSVHLRTAKEMSDVPAHWEQVEKLVALRDEQSKKTLLIGNGDIINKADGLEKAKRYSLDGIMIGRGVFHDLFAFTEKSNWQTLPPKQKILILKEHVTLFDKTWGESKNFAILKKYFKIYISGFDGAGQMRASFMETQTPSEALKLADMLLPTL